VLRTRYARLRQHASGIVTSNYDVSDVCNLRCEGCLYFEGSDRDGHADTASDAAWARMFESEGARGVSFAYLAGAEPALVPERLRLAAQHIGRGVVFTNGTVPIDARLPFALHVSLWGDEQDTPLLRGGASFAKAFRLFGGDPRARFIYTVNAKNIESTWAVAEHCARQGAVLSFSLFSPTEQYKSKLADGSGNDTAYFRISQPGDQLAPNAVQLAHIRATLDAVAARHPGTVLYRPAYNRWVTDPAGLYAIDPVTGWATDCGTRIQGDHRHVRADLSTSASKCCSPNIDCRDCRAYSMAAGTAVMRLRRFAATYAGFCEWIDIAEQWSTLFLRDFPLDVSHAVHAAQAMPPAAIGTPVPDESFA
jgi:hypothetical protein